MKKTGKQEAIDYLDSCCPSKNQNTSRKKTSDEISFSSDPHTLDKPDANTNNIIFN